MVGTTHTEPVAEAESFVHTLVSLSEHSLKE